MEQYIDKSALVAEIKRRMDENRRKQALPQYFGMIEEDLNILSFIDTLEVKEANSNDAFIEKACEWLKNHYRDYMHNPTGERLEAFFGGDMINDLKQAMKDET